LVPRQRIDAGVPTTNKEQHMNTIANTSALRRWCVSMGLATAMSVIAALVPLPAQASRPVPDGLAAQPVIIDIAEYVAERKTRMAQDRVDRAWLFVSRQGS
jgi:hypothetical protein